MTDPCSHLEMDAIIISRLVTDDDRVFIGANLPAPRAGVLLAHLSHSPRMRIIDSLSWVDMRHIHLIPPSHEGMDLRDAIGAQADIRDNEVFDDARRMASFFVIGGIQIDRLGNSNLAGIPRRGKKGWSFRAPGPIGTSSMGSLAHRIILYTTRHDTRTLVEKCDVVTTLGWGNHSADRARLGLKTPGPEALITPLGIFDFPEPDRVTRLVALRNGATVDDVVSNTAFDVDVSPDLMEYPAHTVDELKLLRERVDPEGLLRA